MFKQTESKENDFLPAAVSCTVAEVFDDREKSEITVTNTGNIDAYLRVRLVSHWVDAGGSIVAKPSPLMEVSVSDGWIAGTDNTYYCKAPVAPGAKTINLLFSPIVLQEDFENGYVQVIDVFAEAIQSKPERAVKNSWRVSTDGSGNILPAP